MHTDPFVPKTALDAAALAIATIRFEATHPLEVVHPTDYDIEMAQAALDAAANFATESSPVAAELRRMSAELAQEDCYWNETPGDVRNEMRERGDRLGLPALNDLARTWGENPDVVVADEDGEHPLLWAAWLRDQAILIENRA